MNRLFYIFLTLSLALSNLEASEVAYPKLKFKKITNKRTKEISEYRGIIKDNLGYIWFSSRKGLYRYDGYNFEAFNKEGVTDKFTQISPSLQSIAYDQKNGFWLGGLYSLIFYDDSSIKQFFAKKPAAIKYLGIENEEILNKTSNLLDQDVKKILIEENGDVWLGMYKSLGYIEHNKSEIQTFSPWVDIVDSDFTSLQLNSVGITDIIMDRNGYVWLATRNVGLIKYDKKKNKAKIIKNKNLDIEESLELSTMIKLTENSLLLETTKGVLEFDTNTEEFYLFPRNDPITEPITAVFKSENGDIWIGGKNLYKINFDKSITVYYQQTDFNIVQNDKTIGEIFIDEQETIYVAFNNYGIFRASPKTSKAKIINNINGTNGNVQSIEVDENGLIWVGYSEGLVQGVLHPGKFTYKVVKHENGENFKEVKQIHIGKNKNIWIAEKNRISLIKPNNEIIKYDIDKNIFSKGDINSLVEDYQGVVWFSVFSKGVYKLDPVTGRVTKEAALLEQELHLWQYVELLLSENRKILTYVKNGDGFGEYDLIFKKFTRVYKDNYRKKLYEHPVPFREATSWVVKKDYFGKGFWNTHSETFISFYNSQSGKGRTINTPVNELIVGVLPRKNNLWLYGENGGVHFWDRKNDIVTSFNEEDGIPDSGVSGFSGAKLDNEKIMLGSRDGIVLITPDSFNKNPYLSSTVISSVNINNKKIDIRKFNSGKSNELKLKYNQNIVEFSFFGSSTSMPFLNKHRYRLVGLYDEWIEAKEGERTVRYTNLDAGTYIFEVQSSNNDGVWGEHVSQTTIKIANPLWANPFAYLIYTLFFFMIIWVIFKLRTKAIEISNLKLKQVVAKKTTKIAKLLDFKNHFLLDLTHEFKTRLQLQQKYLEEFYQHCGTNSEYHVDDLRYSNQGMARIVDQLLQLANQQETDDYIFTEINVGILLNLTAHLFDHLAKTLNIVIAIDIPETELYVKAHEDSFERIFTNLIGNAIKYNKQGGRVTIKAIAKDNFVVISIIDTGVGIAGHKLPNNIKYLGAVKLETKLDHAVVSHGLGLKLVVEDVNINNGEIKVESSTEIGTSFILKFQRITSNKKLNTQLCDNTRQMIELETKAPITKEFDINRFQDTLSTETNRDTIVVIEDTVELLEILATFLKDYFNVVIAQDGEKGLELCKLFCPDIVLTDLKMPKLSGFSVLEKIKQDELLGHIPVVVLTAVADEEIKIQGLNLGADDVIAKPVRHGELLKRLQNKLAARDAFWQHYTIENQLRRQQNSPIDCDIDRLSQYTQQSLHADKWLEKIHSFIIENIAKKENLKVDNLAKHMGCTTSFITAKLKSLTGIDGVKGYMRDFRIIMAHKKLTTQKVGKIAVLAEEHGFSEAQFSKDYKRKYGRPPRDTKFDFEKQPSKLDKD